MAVHNADIAAMFEEIADLLEIQGANPFRVRAYRNAARTVEGLGRDLAVLVKAGEDLTELPGIGEDLAAKIREAVETGRLAFLDRLHKELPPAITELLKIPGLGPKRVKALYHDLGVQTLEQLARAARDGRIRELPGFGAKTEEKILEAVEAHLSSARRFKLAVAAQYAAPLVEHLRKAPGVGRVVVAGSFRRMRETVGDLDILVTTTHPEEAVRRFAGYEEVKEVLSKGGTRASVVLRCGLQVDLRVVAEESYGAALHYFTGSKAHNIAIRRLAQERGLKVNEYGVYRGEERIAGRTEEEVYATVDLPYIPPELREDQGEIEAARAGRLPQLVELADLKGDLHAHTKATDGKNTLEEMAEAARKLGFEYLAITEHSRRLTVAHGLDPRRLEKQIDEIERLNARLKGIRLLKGIEVDILEDGRLDLPDSVLARLELVVGAVHGKFDLPRARQTERILKAMEHPYFTILAHPTGRLIDERPPYDVDMLKIVRKAKERGCFLELNAHPERLDLLDVHCRMAKDEGVLVAISSDAHSVLDFGNLRYGVGQARRGWLEAKDVLNARPLKSLWPLLARSAKGGKARAR
ncbi:DNA polymerase/3'-5' exonuclease PolX [Pelomicrobium sp. G1]|uniref:DNA polymerase/3'-5' exonuclease PolX n=1 Tax=unclassified Pelomicrobium TaxID=2815318 RepID=UPI003F7645C4